MFEKKQLKNLNNKSKLIYSFDSPAGPTSENKKIWKEGYWKKKNCK